jgi:hypothetical protein
MLVCFWLTVLSLFHGPPPLHFCPKYYSANNCHLDWSNIAVGSLRLCEVSYLPLASVTKRIPQTPVSVCDKLRWPPTDGKATCRASL